MFKKIKKKMEDAKNRKIKSKEVKPVEVSLNLQYNKPMKLRCYQVAEQEMSIDLAKAKVLKRLHTELDKIISFDILDNKSGQKLIIGSIDVISDKGDEKENECHQDDINQFDL